MPALEHSRVAAVPAQGEEPHRGFNALALHSLDGVQEGFPCDLASFVRARGPSVGVGGEIPPRCLSKLEGTPRIAPGGSLLVFDAGYEPL